MARGVIPWCGTFMSTDT